MVTQTLTVPVTCCLQRTVTVTVDDSDNTIRWTDDTTGQVVSVPNTLANARALFVAIAVDGSPRSASKYL